MKLWFRQGESLNLDSLVPVEVLATKDMLEYGTSGIKEQLYGLQIEMTRLSTPMELSELEQMARSRYLDTSSRKVHWYWKVDYSCDLCTTANMIVNLTDDGNLVLYNNETSLWESFENPTDTLLPGMSMSEDMSLTSWRDRDDPGSGNYMLKHVPLYEGDQKTLIIYQGKNSSKIYWKSVKEGQLTIISDHFSADASLRFPERSNIFDRSDSNVSYYAGRLVMNFSGMIELREQKNRTWSLIEAEPRDNCSLYNFCGKFGSCNPNNKLACKCLPGFMPDVPEKWHSGDFRNGCTENNKPCGDRNTFLSLKMMMGGDKPQESYYGVDENECKETCLQNCDCKSYSYDEKNLMPDLDKGFT